MLDKKSLMLLKTLNKLSIGTAYKVVTADEIITTISQKNLFDFDNVKEILDFLEKQDYINIKFSEENTYCYSLLPKARIYLEQVGAKNKSKPNKSPLVSYAFTLIASFIGTTLAMLVFIYLMF